MGIFTSPRRRAEQAAQTRLTTAQANANRLRMFLPSIAAGLGSEGYRYAQRAIGVLVAIAGWPSLASFVYQLGYLEFEAAQITSEDEGWRMDRAVATTAAHLLTKTFAEPITLHDVQDMQTVASLLMVWWGFSDLADPQHAVTRLIRHFGGHPFKSSDIKAIEHHNDQIRRRLTPEALEVWKEAEREMSTYGDGLPAA
jgi:hypothetical protein